MQCCLIASRNSQIQNELTLQTQPHAILGIALAAGAAGIQLLGGAQLQFPLGKLERPIGCVRQLARVQQDARWVRPLDRNLRFSTPLSAARADHMYCDFLQCCVCGCVGDWAAAGYVLEGSKEGGGRGGGVSQTNKDVGNCQSLKCTPPRPGRQERVAAANISPGVGKGRRGGGWGGGGTRV